MLSKCTFALQTCLLAASTVALCVPVAAVSQEQQQTDDETLETVGAITAAVQELLVAIGADHGFGNLHFKSSTNRAPRRTTAGEPGEHRVLRLQLKLLADVGLLGLPNAGKSTLISTVSAARP